MLIRLCGHFKDNPNHIDKLICINGLPNEWFFRPSIKNPGGKELIVPWVPEVEANVPRDIRNLCEEHEVTVVFPPIEKGGNYTIDKKKIIGVKMDYMSQPGQEAWEKIERFLDMNTPRDQRVAEPVLVAPNQKSGFDPHMARRTNRGSLELQRAEIPVVDLTPQIIVPTITASASLVPQQAIVVESGKRKRKPEEIVDVGCEIEGCTKRFTKKSALRMHLISGHKKKEASIEEPVSAGV